MIPLDSLAEGAAGAAAREDSEDAAETTATAEQEPANVEAAAPPVGGEDIAAAFAVAADAHTPAPQQSSAPQSSDSSHSSVPSSPYSGSIDAHSDRLSLSDLGMLASTVRSCLHLASAAGTLANQRPVGLPG